MGHDYIDGISAYCDRWCERCAFTSRCAVFAAEAAIAMCGDVAEGLALAAGSPAQVPFGPARPAAATWFADLDDLSRAAPESVAAAERERRERQARVDAHPVVKGAWAVSMLASQWLKTRAEPLRRTADPLLAEALAIARHDLFLITVKLTRAVDGRDAARHGDGRGDEDPIQNDWNGSAKVASICLERSIDAWSVLADASGDENARDIAERLQILHRRTEEAFPSAAAFVRPGFDETGR
jgi:hypothetical protein